MNQVQFGKSIIKYSVIKSKRAKTSQIVVDRDNVIVRTPLIKSKSEIEEIVKEKAGWIYKKQFEFKKQKSSIVKPTYSDGSTIPHLGKNCILKINLDQKKDNVKYSNSRFLINLTGKRFLKKQVQRKYEEWLNIRASKYLETRTAKLGVKIGIKPSKITIKNLIGKWGSASKGTITLNSNLMKCPKDTIDYIIVHELCHLKIQDHSHRYWNLVRKNYPKYEEKVKELEILSRIIL